MQTQTPSSHAPATSEGLRFLLGQPHQALFPFLEEVFKDGGQTKLGVKETTQAFRRENGQSGFRYLADGWIQGHLGLVVLEDGFALHTSLAEGGLVTERTDVYDARGELTHSHPGAPAHVLFTENLETDLECPLRDHLFNFLAGEYERAGTGEVRSAQVVAVEHFLRAHSRAGVSFARALERRRDPLIRHLFHRMLLIEAAPVLTWEERQVVYERMLAGLARVLKVKRRALGMGGMGQGLLLLRFRWASFLRRFKTRPLDNLQGLAKRYTWDKMVWFIQTVRNNLGYSVALAVYGPFTYYFITMPMNPHAMQAVGRVRSAYIDTKTRVADGIGGILQAGQGDDASASSTTVASTSAQASATTASPTVPALRSDAVGPSLVAPGGARRLGMPLTPDDAKADGVDWYERMGNFKQMQIAYEEGLEFAPRLGRLEQLETLYNFPMVMESTWLEIERYNASIFRLRQRHPELSAKFKQFLVNEVNRSQQLQLYLWDRMARFILDQPYVMMDRDGEQKKNDYYVGRAFVFMDEMTRTMGWRYPDFKRPQGYEKIAELAKKYQAGRKEKGDIFQNLQANSDLFKQKDPYSTAEFRSYMKRQWEVLYLQNAKAEEAANNGLNMYIWSVRNTVWVLQSIYSAKRTELELLAQRDLEGQLSREASAEIAKLDLLYETFFHNLTLEWVGVKAEIGSKLAKDIETEQRRIVVENLKEGLTDRAKLFSRPATTAHVEAPNAP